MKLNFVLCVFMFALMHHHADSYTMNETCQYYTTGFVGDPENCQGYGYCQNNVYLGKDTCPSGYLFDVYTATCKTSSDVTCELNLEEQCKQVQGPVQLIDPNNCARYCYCLNSVIIGCNTCPAGQVFFEDQCVWQTEEKLCPQDSICRLVPNYQIVGDPDNCGNYIVCFEGTGISQSCPSGLFFNDKTGKCQSTNPCGASSPSTPGSVDVATLCKSWVSGTDLYVSDGQTCSGYVTCTSTTTGLIQTCPYATHFNPDLSLCVTPYTYACPYDRCNNLNTGFMTAIDAKCKEYVTCTNSVTTTAARPCTTSYPYFNEFDQICTNVAPSYNICS